MNAISQDRHPEKSTHAYSHRRPGAIRVQEHRNFDNDSGEIWAESWRITPGQPGDGIIFEKGEGVIGEGDHVLSEGLEMDSVVFESLLLLKVDAR